MPSIAKMFGGGKRSPNVVRRDQLPELIRQLREDGTHYGKCVAPTAQKAREFFRIKKGVRGDWMVLGSLQGQVLTESPTRWLMATNGGAWMHAAAGWWPSEDTAKAALEAGIRMAYGDEFAAAAEAEAHRAAGAALRDKFAVRLAALEIRRQAVRARYDIWMSLTGFSVGGAERPYTEEAVDAFEVEIEVEENAAAEKAAFDVAAPAFIERLIVLGVKIEMTYDGARLVVDGYWKTAFPATATGLQELQVYVEKQERPVEAKKLNLSGLFGGTAKVTKK